MNNFAHLFHFYQMTVIKILRIFLFIILLSAILLNYVSHIHNNVLFSVFLFFIMHEIFIHFKVAKVLPSKTVSSHPSNIIEAFTLSAASGYISVSSASDLLHEFFQNQAVLFLLQKSRISTKEIHPAELSKETIATYASSLVEQIHGTYITPVDLVASYLLLTEQSTQLLFSKELKQEDFVHILLWARFEYKKEENPLPFRLQFCGEGIAQEWVSGWTLETQKYSIDFTSQILSKPPVLIDRVQEYQSIIEGLSRHEKNNSLLIGEPGSGKNALIEKLAYDSYIGKIPSILAHKKILQLQVVTFLAGTQN